MNDEIIILGEKKQTNYFEKTKDNKQFNNNKKKHNNGDKEEN